jgi:PTS system mannose-specific IIA component
MIGLVLVTHGQLATEFRAALEHVVGHQEACETVSIGPEDNMEERRRDIVSAVDRVNDGSGVILLTDMFGGTPSNLAISVMEAGRVEVVAGVRSDGNLANVACAAQDAGRKYINVASKILAPE